MNKTTSLVVLLAGLTLTGSLTTTAYAQSPSSGFVDINGGAQTQSRTFKASTSFPLYGETAGISSAQAIDSGGLFDVSGGYRIVPVFGIGVGVSTFSRSGDGSLAASIPSPAAFNKAANVTNSVADLKHSEVATHVLLAFFVRLTGKIDATVSVGPSFFRVSQDILSATVLAGTQNISAATHREKANTTGVNGGVSLNIMVAPKYGLGAFARYAGATASLPSTGDLKVGGLQVGGGLRLRF